VDRDGERPVDLRALLLRDPVHTEKLRELMRRSLVAPSTLNQSGDTGDTGDTPAITAAE